MIFKIIAIFFLITISYAQEPSNHKKKIEVLKLYIDSLVKVKNYNQSILLSKKRISLLREEGSLEEIVNQLINISILYRNAEKYTLALNYLDSAELIYSENESKDIVYKLLKVRGAILVDKGEYLVSKKIIFEALKKYQFIKEKSIDEECDIYNSLGLVLWRLNKLDSAIYYYQKIESIVKNKREITLRISLARAYNNIGIIHTIKKELDIAITYYQKAVSIYEKQKYSKREYYETLNNFGSTLKNLKKFDDALRLLFKVIETDTSILARNHSLRTSANSNIGILYASQKRYEVAIPYFNKALSIRKEIYDENHPQIARAYSNLGTVYRFLLKYEKAAAYLKQAVNIYNNRGLQYSTRSFTTLNSITDFYIKLNKFDSALVYSQKMLEACVKGYNTKDIFLVPIIEKSDNKIFIIESILRKNESLIKLKKEKYKELIFANYRVANNVIQFLLQRSSSKKKKLVLSSLNHRNTELIIEYVYDNLEKYNINDIYKMIIQAKGLAIKYLIKKPKNLIPKEILEKELMLRDSLTHYELLTLHNKSFIDKKFYFLQESENFYKKYHTLYPKEVGATRDLKDLEAHLNTNDVIINYFLGKEHIYTLVTSRKGSKLVRRKVEGLEKDIPNYIRSLKKINKKASIKYSKLSYNKLIKPIEDYISNKKRLFIIPDSELFYLPFGALIDEKDKYLIENFNILYTYTVSQFFKKKKERNKYQYDFVGFAPIFSDAKTNFKNDNITRSLEISGAITKSKLNELKESKREVESVKDQFQSKGYLNKVFLYKDASKKNFISSLKSSRFLHIATHSFYNELEPELSAIAFSWNNNQSYKNLFFTKEAYTKESKAELIVMSSCESAIGELSNGEGVLSSYRGFLYSGVQNVVSTLWKINDKPSSKLMIIFYKYILEGKKYSQALRLAKLEMIKDSQTSFPKNWAAFILFGRDGSFN